MVSITVVTVLQTAKTAIASNSLATLKAVIPATKFHPEACSDGVDNDNDPYIDCDDLDCGDVSVCAENTDSLCSDGVDNNNNNFTDCEDFDCLYACDVTVCTGGAEDRRAVLGWSRQRR